MIAAWVGAVATVAGLGLPSKLQDERTDEPTSFLPGEVESVRALRAVQQFPGGVDNPAVVVAAREGGLTPGGFWRGLGERLARQPRLVWTGGLLFAAIACTGVTSLDVGLPQNEQFRRRPESVRGQDRIARNFPPGVLAPATVVVGPGGSVERARAVLGEQPGVASLGDETRRGPSGVGFNAVLGADPYSSQAFSFVEDLRDALDGAGLDRG